MTSRTHIVLVPGFVGFDALGQLEYYAGVTEVFERWRSSALARDRNPTLHYFDNFPTASVALRARRLREYLLKRVARGEFSGDDRVTLIGHSTGGLDIRKAVYDMATTNRKIVTVDTTSDVPHEQLLGHLQHLVFMSVPHYGTNLADFGWAIGDALQALLRDVGHALRLNREPIAGLRRRVEHWVSAGASDLLRAIADALNESDENDCGDESQLAAEREARSELTLWIEHMAKDFAIIGDLRSARSTRSTRSTNGGHKASESPAHFSHVQRSAEMALWKKHGISTRSYASIVPQRAGHEPRVGRRLVSALKTGALPLNACAKLLNVVAEQWWLPAVALPAMAARAVVPTLAAAPAWQLLRHRPDAIFNVMYALCADTNGPFRVEAANIAPEITRLMSRETVSTGTLSTSDCDGVVNTLSMCWPYEPDAPDRHPHFLVEADHGDVIGHYTRRRKSEQAEHGRIYDAYDIFPSGSGFDDTRFDTLWTDAFNSCP